MFLNLTEGQIATLTGTLVGGAIAAVSQVIFYLLAESRRLRDNKLALAKQRLDEFYSPLLTRLLEIEYKLWLDHEVQSHSASDLQAIERRNKWNKQLAEEIALLDREIVDIFRRKRWLALESTVVECQKLIRFLESNKLKEALPLPDIVPEWADVNVLKDLHTDVREHHICLMQQLGIDKCGESPLVPADGSRIEGELALSKYHANLEQRTKEKPE